VSSLLRVAYSLTSVVVKKEHSVQVVNNAPDGVVTVPAPAGKKLGSRPGFIAVHWSARTQHGLGQRPHNSPNGLRDPPLQFGVSSRAVEPSKWVVRREFVSALVSPAVAVMWQAILRSDDANKILEAYRDAGFGMRLEFRDADDCVSFEYSSADNIFVARTPMPSICH